MALTLTQAVTDLESGPVNPFSEGASTPQKKKRINQVLERFYAEHTWRGNRTVVNGLTTTNGILTLAIGYSALVSLTEPLTGGRIDIKPIEWEFQEGGPGSLDWDNYGAIVAIDQGDVSGQRTYRITGDPTAIDTKTFRGLVKKRFISLGDSDNVTPENREALRMGCLALHFEDKGDYERSKTQFADAIRLLNQDLEEYQGDAKQTVQVDPTLTGITNIS